MTPEERIARQIPMAEAYRDAGAGEYLLALERRPAECEVTV